MDTGSTFAYCSSPGSEADSHALCHRKGKEFVKTKAETLFESGLKIAGLITSKS